MTTQSPLFTGSAIVVAIILHSIMCCAWLFGWFAAQCRRVDAVMDGCHRRFDKWLS